MVVKKFLLLVLLLTACKEGEPQPSRWEEQLNPYMSARGYTIASDLETILKGGYPVWVDVYCSGRGCFNSNRALVPDELVEGVRQDFFAALASSRKEYVEDISEKIGIEPIETKVADGENQ